MQHAISFTTEVLLDGDDVFIVREIMSEDVTKCVTDLVSSCS